MILTDGNGRPFDRPKRSEFKPGSKGTQAFLKAFHAYKDQVSDCANFAFDQAFRKALKEASS